jgi:hypothetical protein
MQMEFLQKLSTLIKEQAYDEEVSLDDTPFTCGRRCQSAGCGLA